MDVIENKQEVTFLYTWLYSEKIFYFLQFQDSRYIL